MVTCLHSYNARCDQASAKLPCIWHLQSLHAMFMLELLQTTNYVFALTAFIFKTTLTRRC